MSPRLRGPHRVGIDVRTVEPRMRGIGLSVYHLVREIVQQPDPPELVLFGNADSAPLFDGLPGAVHRAIPHGLADPRWESGEALAACEREGVDLYHGTSYSGLLTGDLARVVTVYDLAFLTHPSFYDSTFRRAMTASVRRSTSRADRTIAISKATAHDLTRELDVPESRIEVVRLGLDPLFLGAPAPAPAFPWQGALRRHVLLAVGMGQARKNTLGVIEAVALLPPAVRGDATLLIVGEGWSVNEAARARAASLGVLDQIVITGPLARDEMPAVYRLASALVSPSFQEGFGLPVLEGLASGIPVVTSRGLGGLEDLDSRLFFLVVPRNPADIARGIRAALDTGAPPFGIDVARTFSVARTAAETLAVYRTAFAARSKVHPTWASTAAGSRAGRSPRVGVDARFLGHVRMGTGRYGTELFERLFAVAPEVRWVLFAPAMGAVDRVGLRGLVEVRLEGEGRLADPEWDAGLWRLGTSRADLDAFLGLAGLLPDGLAVPSIAIAYDLGFVHHPEHYPPALLDYLRVRIPASLRAADHVVAISEGTRRDVIERLELARTRVSVATPGADHLPLLERAPASPPYLLTVTSGGKNKNLEGVLNGFSDFLARHPKSPLRLHLTGAVDDPRLDACLRADPFKGRVALFANIDDDALAEQLAGAAAFVFLSRFEGFGLPVAEAHRAGVPVIASPAVAEVVGDAAIVVANDSPTAVSTAIASLLDSGGPAPRLVEAGRTRARQFRWTDAAMRVVDALRLLPKAVAPAMAAPASASSPATAGPIGLVTTWGIACGIAQYSRQLASALRAGGRDVTVLAQEGEPLVLPDPPGLPVVRCWRRGDSLERLGRMALDLGLEAIHVQHQLALFPDYSELARLLWGWRGRMTTVLTLHEVERGQPPPAWLLPDVILVHSDTVRKYLVDELQLTTPVEVIPIGIPTGPRILAPPPGNPRLLSFGFLHPHKGYEDVVEALPDLIKRHPGLHYRVIGPRQGTDSSYADRLVERARALGVETALEIVDRFAPEPELISEAGAAQVVIFPYRRTPLGNSASVGLALSAGRPIVASRTPFFADLEPGALLIDRPNDLGPAIDRVLSDGRLARTLGAQARGVALDRAWPRTAARHVDLYARADETVRLARRTALRPIVSAQIIAKETDALGCAWYRSCLESLVGYPDELIVVDNGSSPEVLEMVRGMLGRFPSSQLIDAADVREFHTLRNRALAATRPDATHVHWVDTDEIFYPDQLARLRASVADPRFTRWATILVHFMIDPRRIETRQVKWNVFRYDPALRWTRDVHEILDGVPPGRWGFAPVDHLHFGYCRPQWQTFIKWLRYAALEYGTIDRYRTEVVDGRRLPWLRGSRTPDRILDERRPRLMPFAGPYPASCEPWLAHWQKSGLPWQDHANLQVDRQVWLEWQARFARHRAWWPTLDEMVRLLGISERAGGGS